VCWSEKRTARSHIKHTHTHTHTYSFNAWPEVTRLKKYKQHTQKAQTAYRMQLIDKS